MSIEKCVITGKETNHKTNGNIPLHKSAKEDLNRIHKDFNEKLKKAFIDEQLEQNPTAISVEYLEKIAPQFSKKKVLRSIAKEGVEGLYSALEKAEEALKEEKDNVEKE